MTETRDIGLCKAAPKDGKETVGLIISVRAEIPQLDPLISNAAWFSAQAEVLEDALHESLPEGTYDRLLSLMLARSHFASAHGG